MPLNYPGQSLESQGELKSSVAVHGPYPKIQSWRRPGSLRRAPERASWGRALDLGGLLSCAGPTRPLSGCWHALAVRRELVADTQGDPQCMLMADGMKWVALWHSCAGWALLPPQLTFPITSLGDDGVGRGLCWVGSGFGF